MNEERLILPRKPKEQVKNEKRNLESHPQVIKYPHPVLNVFGTQYNEEPLREEFLDAFWVHESLLMDVLMLHAEARDHYQPRAEAVVTPHVTALANSLQKCHFPNPILIDYMPDGIEEDGKIIHWANPFGHNRVGGVRFLQKQGKKIAGSPGPGYILCALNPYSPSARSILQKFENTNHQPSAPAKEPDLVKNLKDSIADGMVDYKHPDLPKSKFQDLPDMKHKSKALEVFLCSLEPFPDMSKIRNRIKNWRCGHTMQTANLYQLSKESIVQALILGDPLGDGYFEEIATDKTNTPERHQETKSNKVNLRFTKASVRVDGATKGNISADHGEYGNQKPWDNSLVRLYQQSDNSSPMKNISKYLDEVGDIIRAVSEYRNGTEKKPWVRYVVIPEYRLNEIPMHLRPNSSPPSEYLRRIYQIWEFDLKGNRTLVYNKK